MWKEFSALTMLIRSTLSGVTMMILMVMVKQFVKILLLIGMRINADADESCWCGGEILYEYSRGLRDENRIL